MSNPPTFMSALRRASRTLDDARVQEEEKRDIEERQTDKGNKEKK